MQLVAALIKASLYSPPFQANFNQTRATFSNKSAGCAVAANQYHRI